MTSNTYTHLIQVYFESFLAVILVLFFKHKIPVDLLTVCDYLRDSSISAKRRIGFLNVIVIHVEIHWKVGGKSEESLPVIAQF